MVYEEVWVPSFKVHSPARRAFLLRSERKGSFSPFLQEVNVLLLATNATVVKDVAPYSIVGGNPATEIRKRFSDDKIEKLLELQWWNWPVEKITANVKALTGNSLEKLIV